MALLGLLTATFLGQVAYLLTVTGRVAHSDQVIAEANALLALLVDGETGMRGYLLTGDEVLLEPFAAEEATSGTAFDDLIQLAADGPEQAARLGTVRATHDAWRGFARRMVEARRAGGDYTTPVRAHEGKRLMDAIRADLAAYVSTAERERDRWVRRAQVTTWVVVGTSLLAAALLGAGLALTTRHGLVRVARSYGAALATAEARAESLGRAARRLETLHGIDHAILAADSTPELIRAALDRVTEAVPAADAVVVTFGPDEEVPAVYPPGAAGPGRAALAGAGRAELMDGGRQQLIPDLGAATRSPVQDRLFRAGAASYISAPMEAEGVWFGALVLSAPVPGALDAEHLDVAAEVARQLAVAYCHGRMREQLHRHADELERRVEERTQELRATLQNVRQLQGLLPICAWCRRVRDDQNYWHQVEHYVAARTDTRFTHGVCPDCLKAEMERASDLEQGGFDLADR